MGLDSSLTSSEFKFAEPMLDIGAFIAEDWARAADSPFAHNSPQPQYDSDPASIAPSYLGGVASQPYYLAEPRPHIDADLALLMTQYSLGA